MIELQLPHYSHPPTGGAFVDVSSNETENIVSRGTSTEFGTGSNTITGDSDRNVILGGAGNNISNGNHCGMLNATDSSIDNCVECSIIGGNEQEIQNECNACVIIAGNENIMTDEISDSCIIACDGCTLDQNESVIIASDGLNTTELNQDYRNGNTLFTTNMYAQGDRIFFINLPTSDPLVVGQLWNDAGAVKISEGPP